MGRASHRKKERRAERQVEARKLRIVVCAYPSHSLEPAAELLKAAVIYGDEVVLHSPTAMLLASVAAMSGLSPGDLVGLLRQLAPALGTNGQDLAAGLSTLDTQVGAEAVPALLNLLLSPSSQVHDLVSAVDPTAAAELGGHTGEFARLQRELDAVVEQQLEAAGAASLLPAIGAGLLTLLPVEDTGDLLDGYVRALWSVLRDPRYHPLFDDRIADLVNAAVSEGVLNLSTHSRSRGRQAGAASGFLARLPTFPLASMDEIVDIRSELDRPLVRFRSQMVTVAQDMGVDAHSPEFDQAAEEQWLSKVRPALLELEELVEEKRIRTQFAAKLPTGGALAGVGGLMAGVIGHAALVGAGAAAGAAAAATAASAIVERAKLGREIKKRPYYLLHRTEELLGQGSAGHIR